ncbi:unknown [Paraprevotella clara CAG:116]|nr:unknown [Paraprevotella clara CAG:116]
MYTVQMSLVVMLIFGCSLSCVTPVASALKSCRLPPPNMGSKAMVKHTMPKPPTH